MRFMVFVALPLDLEPDLSWWTGGLRKRVCSKYSSCCVNPSHRTPEPNARFSRGSRSSTNFQVTCTAVFSPFNFLCMYFIWKNEGQINDSLWGRPSVSSVSSPCNSVKGFFLEDEGSLHWPLYYFERKIILAVTRPAIPFRLQLLPHPRANRVEWRGRGHSLPLWPHSQEQCQTTLQRVSRPGQNFHQVWMPQGRGRPLTPHSRHCGHSHHNNCIQR